MIRLVPYLAVLQWIGGIILASGAADRAHDFRHQGAWPRAMARMALALFVLAAVLMALTAPFLSRLVGRLVPAFTDPVPWRLSAFLTLCQAGWILLLVSMGWTGLLALVSRKRAARAEFERRRERAHGRTDQDHR